MANIDDFFIPQNTIEEEIPEWEYDRLASFIPLFDTFARSTYKSVYIIDYFKQNFLYVADNPFFLCGMPAERVREMGYAFYINQVPEEDLSALLEINRAGFMFLEGIPVAERLEYTISYSFNVYQAGSKNKNLINHQLSPLRLSSRGKIWLALCVVSLPSHNQSKKVEIYRKNTSAYWEYTVGSNKWIQIPEIKLNDYEKEMIKLSAQGFTINDIALRMYKSIDTIKSYRRHLFDKLGVDNIAEAISYVTNRKLL